MIATIRRVLIGRTRRTCALLAALFAVLPISTASASVGIPADPSAHGFIGLCGVDNRPMIGGNINDTPFVWKAISSVPPPAEAQGAHEVATLYIFQPRPNAQATDWTGDTMTATDPYSTPNAPTAQATKLDYNLKYFINEFPPMVHGLYELRMYFGNYRATGFTDTYAVTFIQVSGDRWKVVQGGTVDCAKGKAVSTENVAVGVPATATPTASAPFGGPSGTGVPKNANGVPIDTASAGSTISGATGSSHATSGLAPGVVIHANPAAGSSGSGSTWILVLVLVAAVGTGASSFAYRARARRAPARNRSSTPARR